MGIDIKSGRVIYWATQLLRDSRGLDDTAHRVALEMLEASSDGVDVRSGRRPGRSPNALAAATQDGVIAPKKRAKSAKLKAALKSYWEKMTPAQRAARVKKMQAGRGVKAKG